MPTWMAILHALHHAVKSERNRGRQGYVILNRHGLLREKEQGSWPELTDNRNNFEQTFFIARDTCWPLRSMA